MTSSRVQEIDISVGAESQVAVATTLTSTTAEARYRFSPLERGCYFEGELQGRTAVQQDEGQKMRLNITSPSGNISRITGPNPV